MTFFESLLVLLGIAILLLQLSRRTTIPYPTLLAGAGVALALIPGAPTIMLDPHTALALFIAPVLLDAAFDFPVGDVRRFWRPLISLAVIAVLLSAGAVTWLGMAYAGLPFHAALALGAIVAPPDAAAATAILSSVRMPRRTVSLLKGESLLNDASALLLFSTAIQIGSYGGGGDAGIILRVIVAAPGGILLGLLLAWLMRRIQPFIMGTLSGNIFQFVMGFGAWILAERLGLSAVLCLVTFAMAIARGAGLTTPPRARIHDYAVWETAVFLLNVLAFLLMGFQAHTIIGDMNPERLREAAWFAGMIILCLIAVRMAWVIAYNRIAHRYRAFRGDYSPTTLRQGVLVGWCGMRGLVTLATAFALPSGFPQRDLIVLTAFAVVLATLVIQGLTLAPLVRWLGLDGEDGQAEELAAARTEMAAAALAMLDGKAGPVAEHWRFGFETQCQAALPGGDEGAVEEKRSIGLAAIHRQRERLEELRAERRVDPDAFLILQEELDFAEISMGTEEQRRIEES